MANGNGHNGKKPNGSRNGKKSVLKNEKGEPICGRRKRQCRKCFYRFRAVDHELWDCPKCGEDRHCQETKLYFNGCCYLHGGPSTGPLNIKPPATSLRHGLYTRVWKRFDLDEMFTALMERKDELRDPIESLGNLETRIMQLHESGESSGLFKAIHKAWLALRKAGSNKNQQAVCLKTLEGLIEQGAGEAITWDEIFKLDKQANELRMIIHRMEVERGLLIKLDYSIAMMGAFYNAVKAIAQARCEEAGEPGLGRTIIRETADALNRLVSGSGAAAMRLGPAGNGGNGGSEDAAGGASTNGASD
jgi:hypothetical protein